MEFREATLDNGLEVIAECNPRAYSAAVGFFVKTGARDESDEISGVSHFLEHMVFKGTARRSGEDVNREFDAISPNYNAFTSEEQTVYYAAFLPEYTAQVIDLLADILRPTLRDADFHTEKQVVLEEIAKYDDQPPFGAHEKCMAAHFGAHPLGRSVLGTAASVGGLNPDQMRAYFHRRYSPGNITLAGAGNIDFDAFVELARQHCGHWTPFEAGRTATRPTGQLTFRSILKPNATQQYVIHISDGPAAEDEDRYAARLLATILGDDSGSRMFWELVDTGLAECAAMSVDEYQQAGIFMTFLCCAPEDAQDNMGRIRALQEAVERDGVRPDEIRQAKSKICSQVVLRSERPANRMMSVGGNWVMRREYRTIREVVEAYQAVTADDIMRVLSKYPLTRHTTMAVGPCGSLRSQ